MPLLLAPSPNAWSASQASNQLLRFRLIRSSSSSSKWLLNVLILITLIISVSCLRQPNKWLLQQQQQQQQQQQLNTLPTSIGAGGFGVGSDEEAAIVINSKHSGSPLNTNNRSYGNQLLQQRKHHITQQQQQQQQNQILDSASNNKVFNNSISRTTVSSQLSQPSQEFDSTSQSSTNPISHYQLNRIPASNTTTTTTTTSHMNRRQSAINREPYIAMGSGVPSSSSSSLIRDTSELITANQQHESLVDSELEQRRAFILEQEQSKPIMSNSRTTSAAATTTESWMQSVRDNHHGPLRSRFNLVPNGPGSNSALSSSSSSSSSSLLLSSGMSLENTRRLVSGEQVTPVGDQQQLVMDGHMKTKPGPKQPVPYEQLLAKSVRTDEPTAQQMMMTTPRQDHSTRRNSKFTRRSTEYASSSSVQPDSSTTPLYQEPIQAKNIDKLAVNKLINNNEDTTNKSDITKDKISRVDNFKTILVSNNHRPSPQGKLKELHKSTGSKKKGRMLDDVDHNDNNIDIESRESQPMQPSTVEPQLSSEFRHQQQQQNLSNKVGWSRLLPNLLHRTFNSVFKRLTTSASVSNMASSNNNGHNSQQQQQQQQSTTSALAQSVLDQFVSAPQQQTAASIYQAAVPVVIQTTPSPLGIANFVASALSAAFAAHAAANSRRPSPPPTKHSISLQMHGSDDDPDHHHHHEHHNHNHQQQHDSAAASSQHYAAGQMGSNSMRHETREPGLRQHANKKIIDSMVDLPVSERRDGLISQDRVQNVTTKRKARMSSSSSSSSRGEENDDQEEFELIESREATKGNGSWSMELNSVAPIEPAADFYLGSNLTTTSTSTDQQQQLDMITNQQATAAIPDSNNNNNNSQAQELDEDDQLDFRTTTDSSAAIAAEDDSSSSDAGDEEELLEAADSIIVPDGGLTYEVAHDLGEQPQMVASLARNNNKRPHYGHRIIINGNDDSGEISNSKSPVADQNGDAPETSDSSDETDLTNQEDGGFSLFYAPAPSELVKSYRLESSAPSESSSSVGGGNEIMGEGEGSFARIVPATPAVFRQKPQKSHKNRPKNTIRRPQLTPIEPASYNGPEDTETVDSEEEVAADNNDGYQRPTMTLMMMPTSRIRPLSFTAGATRKRPSSNSNHRNKPTIASKPTATTTTVPAISLKETTRKSSTTNRFKNKTSAKPQAAETNNGGEIVPPMSSSSSISVMDLDPSMTRLAHNKLIVAKFKPTKFKQQKTPSSKPNNSQLLHRSTSAAIEQQPALAPTTQIVRKQLAPLSLSSALLASNALNSDDNNINELVSRRWQMKPRNTAATSTTTARSISTTSEFPAVTSSPYEIVGYQENSTSRSEPEDRPLRIVSDFQFLMPGLASGLAARISSLTRPLTTSAAPAPATSTSTSTTTTTTAATSNGYSAGESLPAESPSRQREASSESSQSLSSSSSAYSGNHNDKFNFSLVQMNNRERINALLFPLERFSNSSSYSVQQQQKEQNKNKPTNQRSRVTTSTQRPSTTTTTTTTTTVRPSSPSFDTNGLDATISTTNAPKVVRATNKPAAPYVRSTTTTTQRPRTTPKRSITTSTSTTTTSTTTTTTTRPPTDDDYSVGQILRNQHHHTASYMVGQKPPQPAPQRRPPLTESERLRNQYLALIGKNSSLDGRIWPSNESHETTVYPAIGNPLGHISLIEAAQDANKYTTLEAAAASVNMSNSSDNDNDSASVSNSDEPTNEHSIVILSDNHHNRQAANRRTSSLPAVSLQSAPISSLPPFNAGHTKYELSSKPIIQEAARKYLEEFVNGTRIRPSSMSKVVTGSPLTRRPASNYQLAQNNTQPMNRRTTQGAAFNSVQGSPPSPADASSSSNPLVGKLDIRAQELLYDLFDRESSGHVSKSENLRKVHNQQEQQNFTDDNNHERIKTHSTIELTPVPPMATENSTTSQQQSTTQQEVKVGGELPERAYIDSGESGDTNNRASMRRNQAKIQSILEALANRTKTTRAPLAITSESDIGDQMDDGDQEFKTTLAATDYPSSGSTSDQMETTKFYAPIKLTTGSSSYFRPPMSTPTPGRGYPNIETLSGSRQKINKPALEAGNNNFEYSPLSQTSMMPSSQAPPISMPTTKLTESLTNDQQLRQTIKNRLGGDGYETSSTQVETTTPLPGPIDYIGTEEAAMTTITTTETPTSDLTEATSEIMVVSTTTTEPTTVVADQDIDQEFANKRRPISSSSSSSSSNSIDSQAEYPEMPTFQQNKPRPVIIRRRPTRRPPPQRVAIANNGEDSATHDNESETDNDRYNQERPIIVPAIKPRRKKRPTKRPVSDSVDEYDRPAAAVATSVNDKRKIIYRPLNVAELGEGPMLIRKRPGYMRLPHPPDNIRIHSQYPEHSRNKTRPSGITDTGAPVSIMLPPIEKNTLKKKDHDIRTRPLTIMDPPQSSSSSSTSGDHLTNENILNPINLNRIPETTIMHDKMLVSYKPGRPLPGSMSSFGNASGKPPRSQPQKQPQQQQQQQEQEVNEDSNLSSTLGVVDSLISSIAQSTSVAPTSTSSVNSSLTSGRPPQLGSGNGGDTHLISIEQQQREQQSTTTRRPPTTASLLPPDQQTSGNMSEILVINNNSTSNTTSPFHDHHHNNNNNSNNHRPIIVINGLFGDDKHTDHPHSHPHSNPHPHPKPPNNEHHKRPNSGSNLLEAGSLSVVAQASHGQANSSRPWYPTGGVSSWPNKQTNNTTSATTTTTTQEQSSNLNGTMLDPLTGSQSSVEQSVFGGSEMPNFGGLVTAPSGSYQNHQLQHQQHIGMPYQGSQNGLGNRPGQRPNKPWRVRRRPQGNGGNGSSSGGSGQAGSSNSAGYNFNSASSVSNYVYRPLLSSVSSFGVLFDNIQIFFARIRTFIISLMVMFLPPLALAASVVNAISA